MRTVLSLISILVLGGTFATTAAAQDATPGSECIVTTEAENEAIVQRWYGELFNQQRLDVIDELVAPEADHDTAVHDDSETRDETKAIFQSIFVSFPDVQVTVDELMSEENLVVARWTATATFQVESEGIPPTGDMATFTGINFFEFSCGHIAESWSEADRMAQYGLVPSASTLLAASPEVSASPEPDCVENNEATNAGIAERWIVAWNTRDLAVLDDLSTDTTILHWGQGQDTVGTAALQERAQAFFESFPDRTVTLEQIVADDDLVAFRWSATGTHLGQFLDLEPTGAEVTWSGINVVRVACGTIAESWIETDVFGLTQQLSGANDPATPDA
jgi:steroid delta-isomerase-like uncharacterized protein